MCQHKYEAKGQQREGVDIKLNINWLCVKMFHQGNL